jgi:hypothetical protein
VGAVLLAVSIAAVGIKQIVLYPHYVLGLEKTSAGGAINPFDMPNLRGIVYLVAGDNRHFGLLAISLSVVVIVVAAWVSNLKISNLKISNLKISNLTISNLKITASTLPDSPGSTNDLKFCLAVLACVLVSYHGLVHDSCVLALPALLLVGWLRNGTVSSPWTRPMIVASLAVLLFSPLQLILLMRYSRLAWLGWAVLLGFVGVAGELRSRKQRAEILFGNRTP